MQKVISLLLLFLNLTLLHAQRGKNGSRSISVSPVAVNEYTTLTSNAAAGATSIQVSNSSLNSNNRFTEVLSDGDLLLIIQMQGAQIVGGNVPEFGTITDYNGAGNYEWAEVKSVPNTNQIELMCGLQNTYLATGKTQVIRIPRYKALTISGFGGIITPQWDGNTGGVVAIEVDSSATLNAVNSIDVSGKGFRGGADPTPNDAWWGVMEYTTSSNTNYGAQKGEGIAGWLTEYDTFGGRLCRGAAANGGGGGNAHNSGGGGGANAGNISTYTGLGTPDISINDYITAWNLEGPQFANTTSSGGGKGGYSHTSGSINALTTPPGTSPGSDDDRRNVGGLGGKPLDYSGNRAFMGGGGGGGEGGSNEAGNGSNGGGIILIRSFDLISGSGTIKANGADGIGSEGTLFGGGNDGSGGGGGGGAIIIQTAATVSGIAIEAKGGNGGGQDLPFSSGETQGPGGGGGGGYVAVPNTLPNVNVAGGINGTTDSNNMSEFPPNGATKGGSGIVITNLPVIETLSASVDTVCNAGLATINALNNPNYSYVWGNSIDNFNLGAGLTFQPFITQTTSFYLHSCNLNQTIEVVAAVQDLPLVDAGTNASICEGEEVILTATAEGNYTWEPNSNLSSTSLLTQSILPDSTTVLYLNASFGENCVARDSVLITVLPALQIELTSNSQNICSGELLTIEAITTGQVTWNSSFTFSETGNNAISLIPSNSGQIYATVTASGFCENADSLSFVVNPLPQVEAGAGTSICAGTSAELSGNAEGTFGWQTNVTLSDQNSLNPTVNPSESTWYFLQTISAEGCINTDSVYIEVGGAAPISAGNDTSICAGTSIQLNASGGNEYSWSNGSLLNDSTIANPTINISESASFILTGSINGSCIARDTVLITVFTLSNPTLSGGGLACNNLPVELSISGVQSVQWEPTNGLANPNALSTTANPSSSTDYIANFIDFNGCSGSTTSMNVSPGSNPISGFSWNQISNFEVVLVSDASQNQTTSWMVNDTIITGDSVVYNFPYETLWDVMQIVSNACGSDTFMLTIEVIKQVGFEDLADNDFLIYPNPSADKIAIKSKDLVSMNFSLQIFNTAGQLVQSIDELNAEIKVIDVQAWPSGVYEFVFTNASDTRHVRFVR
jgi:hypothetical protein